MGARCDGGNSSSLIAKYTIDKWERVGNLQNSRHALRAIANENRIYVVGGYNGQLLVFWRYMITYILDLKLVKIFIYLLSKTEVWTLNENDDTINMKIAEPTLSNYAYYPVLFIVDSDFCTNK